MVDLYKGDLDLKVNVAHENIQEALDWNHYELVHKVIASEVHCDVLDFNHESVLSRDGREVEIICALVNIEYIGIEVATTVSNVRDSQVINGLEK